MNSVATIKSVIFLFIRNHSQRMCSR